MQTGLYRVYKNYYVIQNTCIHTPRNNDNNGDVAYVLLDLTFALIYATGDNVLQQTFVTYIFQ